MERVIGLPDLLQRIFGFLDLASNSANARVCQQWSDLALDMLWKNVDNPYVLFKILAPLGKSIVSERQGYEFLRLPSSDDWTRFLKYSAKVRCLSFRKKLRHPLLASVLETIALTRTTLSILPNLHTLFWEAEEPHLCNLCIIFMHANIKSFTFTLPPHFVYQSPYFFFQEIRLRMPHLTDIDLQSSVPMDAIETEMISLIAPPLKLKKITLPRFYLTTKFTEALSRLPDLVDIRFQGRKSDHGDPMDIRPFAPELTDDAFPNLLGLSMMATFHDAARFFQTKFSPTNLKRLYVESNINESPSSIHSLLSVVSDKCQNLKTIRLVSYPSNSLPDANALADLTIDPLKPLLKLSNLVMIDLVHPHPLALNQTDIELLASSWPSLTSLKLNNHPIHHTAPSSLTLEALVPFAKHCPGLTRLRLCVDANDELVPPVDLVPFQNLEKLDMGVSGITKIEHVALYLSSILPPKCKVIATARWDDPDIVYVQRSPELMKRWEAWSKVGDVLPMLWTARTQERERTRYLLLEKDSKLEQSTAVSSVDMDDSTMVVLV